MSNIEVTPHRIIDNFLSEEEHQDIHNMLMHENTGQLQQEKIVPMYFNKAVAFENDTAAGGGWQNLLYVNPYPLSHHFDSICYPLLKNIKFKAIVRAKVNWYPQTSTVLEHSMHNDYDFPVDNLLYSVNTCDGYTKLECGTKIASVANRALLFRGDLQHCSSTTTDQPMRCNVNINLFLL